MEGLFDTALQFEMPESYDPFPINTTDESEEAEQQRMQELTAFFLRGEKPHPGILAKRMAGVKYLFNEIEYAAYRDRRRHA